VTKAIFGKGKIPFTAAARGTRLIDEIFMIFLIKSNAALLPKLTGFLMLVSRSHLIYFKYLIVFV
jgi:hypothetical protein